MAFVKDDHSFTRGPGAIASLDAVSPARRIAAARAELALRRREVLTQGAIETGQEAAFSRPPPPPPPRPTNGKPLPPGRRPFPFRPKGMEPGMKPGRFTSVPGKLSVRPELVKLPGTTITPPKAGETAPTQAATSVAAPTKAPISIIAGGSGPAWVAGQAPKVPASDNTPPAWAPEPEEAPAAAPAAPAKPASGKILLYAALGVGVLYLLTRKK